MYVDEHILLYQYRISFRNQLIGSYYSLSSATSHAWRTHHHALWMCV